MSLFEGPNTILVSRPGLGPPLLTYLCTLATLAPLSLPHLPFLCPLADSVPSGWPIPFLPSVPS